MRLALLLLAALLTTGTAAAQGTPVACNPFTGFPLVIQLGSRIGSVIVGSENVLCATTKIQAAINTLANQRGVPNGIAMLGADGKVPLSQIPALASTGSATATGAAAAAVSAYQVVYPISGGSGFAPASSSDKTQAGRIVGVANVAATSGAQVTFVVAGPVDNSAWAFTVGPVWLGQAGALVQTAPSTGFAQVIGVAVSPTRVIVQPQTPTILAN